MGVLDHSAYAWFEDPLSCGDSGEHLLRRRLCEIGDTPSPRGVHEAKRTVKLDFGLFPSFFPKRASLHPLSGSTHGRMSVAHQRGYTCSSLSLQPRYCGAYHFSPPMSRSSNTRHIRSREPHPDYRPDETQESERS